MSPFRVRVHIFRAIRVWVEGVVWLVNEAMNLRNAQAEITIVINILIIIIIIWGQHAMELVSEIGRRLTEVSHEPRSTSFLRQGLAVAVQRGNASCIIGTLQIDHHVKWHCDIVVIDLNVAKWHCSSLYDVHNNNNNNNTLILCLSRANCVGRRFRCCFYNNNNNKNSHLKNDNNNNNNDAQSSSTRYVVNYAESQVQVIIYMLENYCSCISDCNSDEIR